MERLTNYEIVMDIEWIKNITGADQYFEIIFSTKDRKEYKIIFERVWDMRWSIENASIARWYDLRSCLPERIVDSSIYVIEDSEYIRYFEQQVMGTRPIDELKHYIISDTTDTTLDILAVKKPVLVGPISI